MPIDKAIVNWIIAHNYGEPKCIFTKSTFSWKGKILEPDIVWHNVLYNKTPLTKIADLVILVSFFSGEDTPSTDTSRYITGSMPLRVFFWPPCIALGSARTTAVTLVKSAPFYGHKIITMTFTFRGINVGYVIIVSSFQTFHLDDDISKFSVRLCYL